jgi:hypothetical protein
MMMMIDDREVCAGRPAKPKPGPWTTDDQKSCDFYHGLKVGQNSLDDGVAISFISN